MRANVARPSIPGSQMSSTTTSYAWRDSRSRHASPLSTASTSYPSSRRTPPSALRTPGSSSTNRIEGIGNGTFATSARQLHRESRTARGVVGEIDAAAMLRDDAPDDGKAQTATALLRRVVRQKQLVSLRRWNPRSVVRDDNANEIVRRIVLRRDLNRAAL